MATQSDADDFDDIEDIDGSELVKRLRRQLKEKSKREEELESQLKQLSAAHRERALKEALSAKGLSDKAAKFYPADADLSDEAIAAWITDNADVFGIKTADAATTPDPGEGEPAMSQDGSDGPVVDPATEAAYRRMQAASLIGSVATTRENDVLRQIAQAQSPEELTALLRQARA